MQGFWRNKQMLETDFQKVATKSEIPAGKGKKVQVGGDEVLVANVGGTYYAIANKCPHMHGDLSIGSLDNEVVTCPKHGAKFNVTTGKAVGNPKMGLFHPKVADAVVYQVKIEGEDILLKR
jgi:3-phenylpropionate/trans-cinnamate dioxygenase ferredoxin component